MRNFQIYGTIGMIIVSIIIGIISASFPQQVWVFAISVAGYVIAGVKILYEQWDKFYLLIQKVKCSLFGLDTLWSMTVKYESNSSNKIEQVKDILLSSGMTELKIQVITSNIIEVRTQGLNIQFIDDDMLEVHIFDMPVTYNRADDLITKTISPLFESIENRLTILNKHYFLAVKFPETNPFLGFYMKKIASKDLLKFDITFNIDNNRVEVCKDRIIVNTTSITELASISKNVLGLSPR